MLSLFAVSAPGLEPYVAQELNQYGLTVAAPENIPAAVRPGQGTPPEDSGGVAFSGDVSAVYRANLSLRSASRVLVRLGEFYAAAFAELRKKAGRLAWENYLRPGQPVAVRVTCHKSRLYHSDGVAERVLGAIGDRLGVPSPAGKFDESGLNPPPQMVIVRLSHDQCTISIDSSGALLHRRGYRLAVAKAPLRETLAAGVLLASAWDGESPLLDPFCGSGTLAIEAALLALGLPAGGLQVDGKGRRFAFMDWPAYDSTAWKRMRATAHSNALARAAQLAGRLVIQASDRDEGAIKLAQANAERAGVAEWISFTHRAVSAIKPPPGPGWVVANPPYGVRVSGNRDLRDLYAQFGNVLRRECMGWRVAVLYNDPVLIGQVHLKFSTHLALVNGGLPVRLGIGQVV